MYSRVGTTEDPAPERQTLWLHLVCLSRKLLTVLHILLAEESSRIMGEGHVCVSLLDILTLHQMTHQLKHLLKRSEE